MLHRLQTLSWLFSHQTRFLYKKSLLHKAPTGHRSTTLPANLFVARFAWKDFDFFNATATDHMQFAGTANLARETYTAGAHYAAVGEQGDLFADVVLVSPLNFGFIQAAVGLAVLVRVVLQVAFAA